MKYAGKKPKHTQNETTKKNKMKKNTTKHNENN